MKRTLKSYAAVVLYVAAVCILLEAVSLWRQPPRWVLVPWAWAGNTFIQHILNAVVAALPFVWAACWALVGLSLDRWVLGYIRRGTNGRMLDTTTFIALWCVLFFLPPVMLEYFRHIEAVQPVIMWMVTHVSGMAPIATLGALVCHQVVVLLLDRSRRHRSFAVVAPPVAAALLLAYINGNWLPGLFSASGLAVNALLLGGALLVVVLLWRSGGTGIERFLDSFPRAFFSPVFPAVLVAILLAVAAVSAFGGRDRTTRTELPNVVLITIDTLRDDHLGCLGHSARTSPNLDAFAREAALFASCVSAAPATVPSIVSLITSRYPSYHSVGTVNGWRAMSLDEPTLAFALAQNGYRTAAFVGNYLLRRKAKLYRGFQVYDDTFNSAELVRGLPERTADRTTAYAENWIQTLGSEPFFLWVHYQDPHGPYTPPDSYREQFPPVTVAEDPASLPVTSNYGYGGIPEYQYLDGKMSPAEYRALYQAEIAFTDEMIGRLIERLKAGGLWENSVVILTADHGEALGEHGFWFCHGQNVMEELIHVPLIVRVPGADQGRRIDELVSLVDVVPTVLDAAGLPDVLECSGLSLLPLINGSASLLAREYVVAEDDYQHVCIRGRRTKYITGPEEEFLFDLIADSRELINIIDDQPEFIAELRMITDGYSENAVTVRDDEMKQSADELRKLKSLGYVE
jgi:arylsulfatase